MSSSTKFAFLLVAASLAQGFAMEPCSDCDTSTMIFDNANAKIIGRVPIRLPTLSADQEVEDSASNATYLKNDAHFAPQTETSEGPVRYYATWSDGQLCSSKSESSFESWEESFGSLAECCDMAFAWDYEACCESSGMGGCA